MKIGARALATKLGALARELREPAAALGLGDDAAQLIVCGLFGARLLDRGLELEPRSFDRSAVTRVLRAQHESIEVAVGAALAERSPAMRTRVDALIAMLAAADTHGVVLDSALPSFYEPFLAVYDPAQRRARGVYFTPPALAAYVVREVDRALELECREPHGLASERDLVLLDPAVGAGVFLSALVARVEQRMRARLAEQKRDAREISAAWQAYVPARLLPRIAGFDVMPVARALAQLQLRLALAATGYRERGDERWPLYAADALSLLESTGTARELLERADVIVGNPPYARGKETPSPLWDLLLAPYKEPLRGEKNLQPLSDAYVRFLRLSEHVLSRKPIAVMGLVTSSTFLDGHLHRGIRASLVGTFPRIFVLDLGGSSKRRARERGEARDANVFEVAQGIAVSICARAPGLGSGEVRYAVLRGARSAKLDALAGEAALASAPVTGPAFVPVAQTPREYAGFVPLEALFSFHSIAAKPGDDRQLVAFERAQLLPQLEAFRSALRSDPALARTEAARRMLAFDEPFDDARIVPYAYRPFDTRFVYDDARLWTRPVRRLRERIDGQPLLLTTRFARDAEFAHVFATRLLPDVIVLSNKTSVNAFAFPYAAFELPGDWSRMLGASGAAPSREAGFAYVYALLHAPSYRRRYAAALAGAFPSIPVPVARSLFDALAAQGAELLALHCGDRAANTMTGSDAADVAHVRVGGYRVAHKWLLDRERAGRSLTAAERARYEHVLAGLGETQARMRAVDAAIAEAGGFPAAFVARA